MTIHPDMARALLDAGVPDFQDAYRIAWLKGIPTHLRKGNRSYDMSVLARKGGATMAAKARRTRDEHAQAVMAMYRDGLSRNRIAALLGIGRSTVGRVIEDAEG